MKSRTDTTLTYVMFLSRHLNKQNIRMITLAFLFDLGFAAGNDGFVYLRNAIELQYEKSTAAITKEIYPAISDHTDVSFSWQYIDQAIRRSIKAAWEDGNPESWRIFFPPGGNRSPKCPSNKEFIARIACIIELLQSCREVDYERI